MAYYSVGETAVDFSGGMCGPGMHKPFPNSSCEALPYGQTYPEQNTHSDDSPVGLPGGAAMPWFGRYSPDFSGGSCGGGMIRTSPTAPCRPIERGMSTGLGELSWERFKDDFILGTAVLVSASLLSGWLRKIL